MAAGNSIYQKRIEAGLAFSPYTCKQALFLQGALSLHEPHSLHIMLIVTFPLR
jgi:hypothetical protein